jgi:hypothetical protein
MPRARFGGARERSSSGAALANDCIGIHDLTPRYQEVSFANVLLGLIDTRYPHYGLIRPKNEWTERPANKLSAMSPV